MVRKTHGVFSQMLDLAVMDGKLPRNPARPAPGTKSFLPKLPRTRDHVYLTAPQLHSLADECGEHRGLVLFLGYTGLRWGEATALRVRDVNPLQGRLTVARSVTEVGGELVWGTPKSHAVRTVPLPAFLRDTLTEALAGKGPDDLVFTSPTGGALRNRNFYNRVLAPAARRALPGIGVSAHDLRHTAASLAIASGAHVKAVQRMLGHESAALTLDTYAGLFADDLDDVAERLNTTALAAGADSVRIEPIVTTLPSDPAKPSKAV
jgi:integrase